MFLQGKLTKFPFSGVKWLLNMGDTKVGPSSLHHTCIEKAPHVSCAQAILKNEPFKVFGQTT